MSFDFQYIRPETLQQALDFLQEKGSKTSVIAGGTDLMIGIRKGEVASDFIVDVSRLEEMRKILRTDASLFVGSAATYTEIIGNADVRANAPVLALSAGHVGSLQIRNVGTLGGNVANASPAADSVPALLVHKTWLRIQSAFAERMVPLEDVITGPYQTNIQPGELITGFLLEPLGADYRFSFKRIARRRALSVARINCASAAKLDEEKQITDVRLALGSITPRPRRMVAAERFLTGKRPDCQLINEASRMVSQEMIRQSGVRSSTEYKRPAVEGLVVRTLSEVFFGHE